MLAEDIESTGDVEVPDDPLKKIIGQKAAVEKVRVAVKQFRHLLLVGPPGTGKSMLAQAIAAHIPKPTQQVNIYDNSANPQRPCIKMVDGGEDVAETDSESSVGLTVSPGEVPSFVSERLGFRCSHCGVISEHTSQTCPSCGSDKASRVVKSYEENIYGGAITDVFEVGPYKAEDEVYTTRINREGLEETIVYRRLGPKVLVLNQNDLDSVKEKDSSKTHRVLIPRDRSGFVQATGASETELLGDVRHDPYGSHPEIGTPAYLRVVPGAVHEAHQGVLFIDELPQLGELQTYILSAMQNGYFPITGRNPHSSGAAVRVDNVPSRFLFVGACNIRDVGEILSPLRSRITGNGYEILLDSTMPDTTENQMALVQFIAQEINMDGRIPHASPEAVKKIITEARVRAKEVDDKSNALTLRLRDLGGVIRLAGDIAVMEDSECITEKHVERGLKESRPIEHRLQETYGSLWKGLKKDVGFVVEKDAGGRGYG